jgi:hypothetical protein
MRAKNPRIMIIEQISLRFVFAMVSPPVDSDFPNYIATVLSRSKELQRGNDPDAILLDDV